MPLNLVIAQSGPVRLAPPQKITQEKQEDIPPSEKSQQVPVGSVVDGVDKSIQVDALQTINPDTAGVLDAKDGGFGIECGRHITAIALENDYAITSKH